MAHNPVGICTSITTSTSNVVSSVLSHQSDSLRVTALTKGAHIGIGTSTVIATPADYFVAADTTEVINIGKPRSQRIVGVSSGTTTTLTLPEGEGSQFLVGDSVSFSVGGNSDYDITEKIVTSVTNVNPTGGVFNQTVVIAHDSDVNGYPDTTRDGLPYDAYLRTSFRVGTLALGSGTAYLQQVQVSGDS